jgi:hypothetical protein
MLQAAAVLAVEVIIRKVLVVQASQVEVEGQAALDHLIQATVPVVPMVVVLQVKVILTKMAQMAAQVL